MVRSRHLRLSLEVEVPRLSSLYGSAIENFVATWEAGVDEIAQTWVPDKVVYRISIFLMTVERIQLWFVERFGKVSLSIDAHWLVPITTSVASFCFFLSLMVQLQSASDSAVLTSVLSLALMEMLVPVAMIGGTTLCCMDILTGEIAAFMIAIVWVASSLGSDSIRHYIYPTLGHG